MNVVMEKNHHNDIFMKLPITFCLFLFTLTVSCGQNKSENATEDRKVGGPCEGCEATTEYGNQTLSWEASMPDFSEEGPKIEVSGTVFQNDGKTPAQDIILYIYHTDQEGIYPPKEGDTGWARRHGYIRTWLKTNEKGQYKFRTLRPASYPNTSIIAHIHIFVKEPGKTAYYIDDFLFEDDPFLTKAERAKLTKRGGNGIMQGTQNGDLTIYNRDIILGLNVPGY